MSTLSRLNETVREIKHSLALSSRSLSLAAVFGLSAITMTGCLNDHDADVSEAGVPIIAPVAHLPHPFNGGDKSGAAVYEFTSVDRPDLISVMVQGAYGDRMNTAFFKKSGPHCTPENRGRLQPVALLDHPGRNTRSLTRVFRYDVQCAAD